MHSDSSAITKVVSGTLARTKRILHVDDDQDWLDVVRAALEDAGHVVLSAKDASQALTMAEGARLDIIILDLDLNGESGLQLMKFLRHNQPQALVILYTGLSHDDDAILSMLQQGALQYVRKGPLEDLRKAVEAAAARAPKA